MSFKRSVFFSLGRPSPKPVPLDVIARIGHTHIVPEEKSEEEATAAQQTDINKLTEAITDAIGKAVKPAVGPTDPTDGQQNNNLVNPEVEDAPQLPIINDPKDDDIWDPPLDPDGLKDKDPDLFNFIRQHKPVIRLVGVDNNRGTKKLPKPVIIVNSRFTDDEIRYTRYTKTNRKGGREMIEPDRFKREILEYNKAYLEGGLNTNKSITGFITEHSK